MPNCPHSTFPLIQQHQTSFITNAKGNFSRQETKEKEKTYNNKPKTIKKMVIGTNMSIIILNVNELNAPTKRHRLAEGYKNKTRIYVVYKRPTSDLGTHTE